MNMLALGSIGTYMYEKYEFHFKKSEQGAEPPRNLTRR